MSHLIVNKIVDLLKRTSIQLRREGLVLPRQSRSILDAEAAARHEAELAHQLRAPRARAPRRLASKGRDGGARLVSARPGARRLAGERDAFERDSQLLPARLLALDVQRIARLRRHQRRRRFRISGLERAHDLPEQPRAIDLFAGRVERRRRREREPSLVLLHGAAGGRLRARPPHRHAAPHAHTHTICAHNTPSSNVTAT